jgi:dihydrofolate reductase
MTAVAGPKKSLIVAISENGVIGRAGQLPWRLSDDLRRFKRLTMGHSLIMGRRTFESIGRALPGRKTIVVTRQVAWQHAGVLTAHSLPEAYAAAAEDAEIFVVGGAEIYDQALDDCDRLYVTRVQAHVDGDAFFPEVSWSDWQLIEESSLPADERNTFATTFCIYGRRTNSRPADAPN